MHLADDSGLSSSDSEVEAEESLQSVKTDVIKKTEAGDNNKDSRPFEDSDNEDEDTVLDHINLGGELSKVDSESKKVERESVKKDLSEDDSKQVGFDGERTDAKSETKSTNDSGPTKEKRKDDNMLGDILEDNKDTLEAKEDEGCAKGCEDAAGHVLPIDAGDEDGINLAEQSDTSEEVNIRCEVSDTSSENVSCSESVTVQCDQGTDEPKEAVTNGHAENSGMITFSIEPHAPQSEGSEAQQHIL